MENGLLLIVFCFLLPLLTSCLVYKQILGIHFQVSFNALVSGPLTNQPVFNSTHLQFAVNDLAYPR